MKNIPHLFADITAGLEDLHAVAVEGQCRDNAPEMQVALAKLLRNGFVGLDAIVIDIALRSSAHYD